MLEKADAKAAANWMLGPIRSWLNQQNKEIDEFIDTGLKEFYLRPKQMWQMLISIRSVGDLLRKLHGFKAFLDYFWKKFTGHFKRNERRSHARISTT